MSVLHMAFITGNEGRDGWTLTTNKGPRPNSNCGRRGSWSTPYSPLGCPVITFFTWGVFFSFILNHLPEIISTTLKNSPNPYLQPLHSELSLFLSPPVRVCQFLWHLTRTTGNAVWRMFSLFNILFSCLIIYLFPSLVSFSILSFYNLAIMTLTRTTLTLHPLRLKGQVCQAAHHQGKNK